MAKTTNGTFIKEISVIDPDGGGEVTIAIYKLDGGGMVGIDSSFIESEEPIYSPFDKNLEINLIE